MLEYAKVSTEVDGKSMAVDGRQWQVEIQSRWRRCKSMAVDGRQWHLMAILFWPVLQEMHLFLQFWQVLASFGKFWQVLASFGKFCLNYTGLYMFFDFLYVSCEIHINLYVLSCFV